MDIPVDHLQRAVAQDLFQPKDVTTFVVKKIGGVGMAAEMSVQFNAILNAPFRFEP